MTTMAATARLLLERAAVVLNSTLNETNTTALATNAATLATNADATANATKILISSLVFAESRSIRNSTIILAAFNVLASFTTATSILYDCYWASKRCNPKFKASKFCVRSIHPAETFPLVLAIGVVIQGLVFAGVQGEGLSSLFTDDCKVIAQFMWPAVFIVPYLQLVFGIECALRSFRFTPFQARGKYDVAICISTVVVMLIGTWIPSIVYPESRCFASLVWYIEKYRFLAFVMLSTVGGLMALTTLTIFIRLSTVDYIDQNHRIAASRMVYYLGLGIVSLVFVIPFFGSLLANHGQDGDLRLAMMATVVLNLSGLMNGLLQLYLRTNTTSSAFGPKIGKGWENQKHEIRIFGPNELSMQAQLLNPVTGPQSPSSEWTHSRSSLVGLEKSRGTSLDSFSSQPYLSAKAYEMQLEDLPSTYNTATTAHTRKSSYSIFPSLKREVQPTSIYDISDLAPPSSLHVPGYPRRKHSSSTSSSGTFVIGLRLSQALPYPLSATTYSPKPNSLTLPPTAYELATLPTSSFSTESAAPLSPLRVQTNFNQNFTPPGRSLDRPTPAPLDTNGRTSPEQSPARGSPSVNKTLPPTPKYSFPAVETLRASTTQLSPAVYSPDKKFPAPGLGALGAGPRSANLLKSNPIRANPLDRANSSRMAMPSITNMKQDRTSKDWI